MKPRQSPNKLALIQTNSVPNKIKLAPGRIRSPPSTDINVRRCRIKLNCLLKKKSTVKLKGAARKNKPPVIKIKTPLIIMKARELT